MIIKKITASYGKLQNSSLELKAGLNIVTAPNESGKSTWCSFITNMLYGIETNERARAGFKPDKIRFAPWNGAPMSGTMELEHDGREISLTRTGRESAPLREVSVQISGTSDGVNLSAQTPGESFLGITRDVFERSAFIGQGNIAISSNPELEKRIASIVQTGDEALSYTEAATRLRAGITRRRHNKTGLLPTLEGELDICRRKLQEIENEKIRGEELVTAREKAIEKRDALIEKLAQQREWQRKSSLDSLAEARVRVEDFEEKLEGCKKELALASATLNPSRFGEVNSEQLKERSGNDVDRLRELRRHQKKAVPVFAPAALSVVFALLCVFSVILSLYNYIPAIACGMLMVTALVWLYYMLLTNKARRLEMSEILAFYGLENEEAIEQAVKEYEAAVALFGRLSREHEALSESLISERRERDFRSDEILKELNFSSNGSAAAELARQLEDAEAKLRAIRESFASHLGRISAIGERDELVVQIETLTSEHKRISLEYDALELAEKALREAGSEIQSRLTPRLSTRSSEIFARLTNNRYDALALDRQLQATAKLSDDTLQRETLFLSAGALDQLYLAVRLAICELALPENHSCPLVLDDILGSFDDERCLAALELLREMASGRQVILFTCHSREAEMMKSYLDVNIL